MNTTFNFSRFLKVLSNEWCLNRKKMLLFWGGIIAIGVLYFSFHRFFIPNMIFVDSTFWVTLFLMCILQGFYLQIYFRDFSSKKMTQTLLLLPASRNETFWAKFLLGVVLYAVIFCVFIFIAVKATETHNIWIKKMNYFESNRWEIQNFDRIQTLTIKGWGLLLSSFVWLFSASFYLLGILIFRKIAVLKTFALAFIAIMGAVLTTFFVYFLFTGVIAQLAFPGIVIWTDIQNIIGCDIVRMYPVLMFCFGIFVSLALILIARMKYNEKTI
jgi:hypothetical protein